MDELDLLDWRRRVDAMYDEVRTLGPRVGHVRWRAIRDQLFREHPQSPLPPEGRAAFSGLRYWEYDPAFRFAGRVRARPGDRFELRTTTGEALAMRRFGVVELPIGSLDVFWVDVYGGGVFIPFRDGTSGKETYGGGRYLIDTVKGADLGSNERGELVLDLNFAYHPSCHYDVRWSCPLAPRENWLEAEVRAGEMSYPG
ncbi:MAG TPA: DUF1684 domain-containing protein [Candidatus Limnocylindria bacterium]|nr:DUF1684 domain-containing protein [Candidatus Limnocylindria bacterium]